MMKKLNQEVLIQLKNVTKRFGEFYAVSDINLEVKRGEIVGFLGPNGAGKSTTMKMIAYLLEPSEGEIWIRSNGDFQSLTRKNKDYLLDNLGFLIENPAFYGDLSPRTILTYFAKLKGYPKEKINQRIEEVLKFFHLEEWIDKKIKTFSKGMRQKIGVASAIIHDPDIIVLDEPQTGLDPKARKEVRDFILALKQMGKTIFLSSHLLYEISEVADRIAIIHLGKIIAFDTLDNLEAKTKKSIIDFELLNMEDKNQKDLIEKIKNLVQPLTGIEKDLSWVKYNENTGVFQIFFDGNPLNQLKILKVLIDNGFKVIEFSVPKAGLLEDLFIELTKPEV
ncbi:MAG: ABC transporter ATP-binding protein [Promethearchaeota archaeon]